MRIIEPPDRMAESKENQALIRDMVNTSLKGKLMATERRDFFKKIDFIQLYSFYHCRDEHKKYDFVKSIVGTPHGIKKKEALFLKENPLLGKADFDDYGAYINLKERVTL